MNLLRLIIFGGLLLVSGKAYCEAWSAAGVVPQPGKPFFSRWVGLNPAEYIELSGGRFGQNTVKWQLAGGPTCSCSFSISGTTKSGKFAVSSCTVVNQTGSQTACTQLNTTYDFAADGFFGMTLDYTAPGTATKVYKNFY